MDEHGKSDELSLSSDGAFMTEEEIKEAVKPHGEGDFPDKGELPDPEEEKGHLHHMPEGEVHYIDENGDSVI
jgi:hypothetical protein